MFIVKDQNGLTLSGYDEDHQILVVTRVASLIKTFPTAEAARTWAEQYVNAGYGLTSFKVERI